MVWKSVTNGFTYLLIHFMHPCWSVHIKNLNLKYFKFIRSLNFECRLFFYLEGMLFWHSKPQYCGMSRFSQPNSKYLFVCCSHGIREPNWCKHVWCSGLIWRCCWGRRLPPLPRRQSLLRLKAHSHRLGLSLWCSATQSRQHHCPSPPVLLTASTAWWARYNNEDIQVMSLEPCTGLKFRS